MLFLDKFYFRNPGQPHWPRTEDRLAWKPAGGKGQCERGARTPGCPEANRPPEPQSPDRGKQRPRLFRAAPNAGLLSEPGAGATARSAGPRLWDVTPSPLGEEAPGASAGRSTCGLNPTGPATLAPAQGQGPATTHRREGPSRRDSTRGRQPSSVLQHERRVKSRAPLSKQLRGAACGERGAACRERGAASGGPGPEGSWRVGAGGGRHRQARSRRAAAGARHSSCGRGGGSCSGAVVSSRFVTAHGHNVANIHTSGFKERRLEIHSPACKLELNH